MIILAFWIKNRKYYSSVQLCVKIHHMNKVLIGLGNIGKAIIRHWRKDIITVDPFVVEADYKSIDELRGCIKYLNLACKPQDFRKINWKTISANNVISYMAGINIQEIADYFPKSNIVRVMPNLGAVVGCSTNLICGARIDNEIYNMISLLGKNFIINDEKLLDSLAPITGSGLAYFYLLADCLSKIIVENFNQDPKFASDLVAHTLNASVKYVQDNSELDFSKLSQ